ncbi:MAG: ribbon-helix-helix protein, CopG family [Armatimonadota bacterium]
MALSRISITIPEQLVRAADARAKAVERSRSWVLVQALRQYLASGEVVETAGTAPRSAPAVRERSTPSPATEAAAGRGLYREAQLQADLALTPEARVKEAERAARVAELRAPRWRRARVLTFERYEDYLDWERWEDRLR